MAVRSLFAPLVVGACASLALVACGDSAGEPGPMQAGPTDTTSGQATLTSTSAGTPTASSTVGTTNTTAVTATLTTTSGSVGTTGGAGAGGQFSDTTMGDVATSTSANDASTGGVSGTTGSGGTSTSASSATGGGGSGGLGGTASGGSDGGTTDGEPGSECEFSGNLRYQFNQPESWPSEVVELLTSAMDDAMYYYNCYADFDKALTINYDPGVPTAQGNVDGWISFGSSRSYMVVATAMHEVAHTLGVGYSPWTELMDDGTWTGPAVVEFMMNLPAEQRDPDMYSQRTYITGDSQHFWPYGLNQASEHQSEWSLINNVRIVAAMQLDKQAYLAGDR